MNYIYNKIYSKFARIFIICICFTIYTEQSFSEPTGDQVSPSEMTPDTSTPDTSIDPSKITDLHAYIEDLIRKHNEGIDTGISDIHGHLNELLKKHDEERHKSHHSLTEHIHKGHVHKEGSHLNQQKSETE